MIAQIAYTNSNCSDLWPMFIGENRLHTDLKLYMISDWQMYEDGVFLNYVYDNDDKYWSVWYDAIMRFNVPYFIYLQEDFILYDDVDEEKIMEYVDFLRDHQEYSFVRLLKATSFKGKQITDTLFSVESNNKNVFAMQPTIWRSLDYLRLLRATKEPKWLETPNYRKQMIDMNMKGVYHYDGEDKIGKYHYDSNVYPYIATALVKGKWAMSEYGDYLKPLLGKYGINPKGRGIV